MVPGMIRRMAITLWLAGIALFVLGSLLPWARALVGETTGMTSFRPIDDAEVGWMLLPLAFFLLALLIVVTRAEGLAYRLIALVGFILSGYTAFMVNAILDPFLLGTDEYVLQSGRSITLLGTYLLIAGCGLALVSPSTRPPERSLLSRFSRRQEQVSGF